MSIRTRLLLGYVAVIVILMTSGAVIIVRMTDELDASVRRDATALVATLREKVDQALQARIQSVQAFAGTSRPLQEALAASNAEFAQRGSEEEIRAAIREADEAWRAASSPTPFMLSLEQNEAAAALRRTQRFHRTVEDRAVFAEMFVTNRWGANVCQTGRTEDYRQDDEDWWKAAWRDGVWASGDVQLDESAGVYSLDIGVRVDGPEGEPLGVLKAVFDITDIAETLDAFHVEAQRRDAFLELIDGDGHIVHRQNDPEAFQQDLSGQAAVRRVLAGEAGTVVETTGHGELLRAFAPPGHDARVLRWSLVWNQPTAIVFARAHELQRWMVGVGILASIAAALVGVFLAQTFSRVTQRLQDTSRALEQNEARLRSVVDGAVDGIVTMRPDGTIESVNPAFCEVFGYDGTELLGLDVTLLIPPPHDAQHADYVQRYLDTGVPHVIGTVQQLRGRRKNGEIFPLELSVSEVHSGDLRLFVGILRDVTESHEARRALEAAKEAAEAASRSKGQFLANMSHELRTPLNAIIGYAEMVAEDLEDRGDEDLAEDLGKVRTAGRHLLGLINDILDVSKIEAGRMELHLEVIDVDRFLGEAIETVQPLMEKNGNEVVLDAPESLGSATTDVTKLRQVLFNLLSNAAKFTENGRVTLRAQRREGSLGEWLDLRVQDTGIGMTAEQLEHVWDAFAQADTSTTREFGGTGLGLTISRSFCEMLGGSIDVESERGAGTAFTLRIPAELGEADGEPLPRGRVASDEGEGTAPLSLDTALVVDDDPAARDLVQRFLARQGMEVVGASSGQEGLELAAKIQPSVILLDVMMPGMDGWAVLEKLRRDPALAHIPVVMLTMVDERRLGFALGVDGYVTKPVDRRTLGQVLAPYRLAAGGHRVLVVEDDEDARRLLARRLGRFGWQVDVACDGIEALERLEEVRPELILTDLMMPRMDGFALVDHLQRDDRFRGIPVVVLTAKELTKEDAARLEGAIEHLLQKGAYEREDLLAEIGRLVRTAVLRRRRTSAG